MDSDPGLPGSSAPLAPAGDGAVRPRVLIDGSNVAHASERDTPRLANILLVRDRLVDQGVEPIIVADATLRRQIDQPLHYERLVADGNVTLPASPDAAPNAGGPPA